jgi:DNA-binding IclR family transcriptional regulator
MRVLNESTAPVSHSELVRQTRASDSTLAKLEREKVIERLPQAARYRLTDKYLEEVPSLPVAQARVCVYLREHGNEASEDELERALELSALTLDTLRKRGWVEKSKEPANFVLSDSKRVPAVSAAHSRMLQVIRLLETEKDEMWVSAVYGQGPTRGACVQAGLSAGIDNGTANCMD